MRLIGYRKDGHDKLESYEGAGHIYEEAGAGRTGYSAYVVRPEMPAALSSDGKLDT